MWKKAARVAKPDHSQMQNKQLTAAYETVKDQNLCHLFRWLETVQDFVMRRSFQIGVYGWQPWGELSMACKWGDDCGTNRGCNVLAENKDIFTVQRTVTQEWQTEDSPSQPWTVSNIGFSCLAWFYQNSKSVPSVDHYPSISLPAYFPSLLFFSSLSTFMPQNASTWLEKVFRICLPLGTLTSSLLPGRWTLPIQSPLLFVFWPWAFHYQISKSKTLQSKYAKQSETGNTTSSYCDPSWTSIIAFNKLYFSV